MRYLPSAFAVILQIKNAAMSRVTMVAPVGVEKTREHTIPSRAHITPMAAELTIAFLKDLCKVIADIAGKIMSAETRSDPTSLIDMEIITAVRVARRRLHAFAFPPVPCINTGSNVRAKILL